MELPQKTAESMFEVKKAFLGFSGNVKIWGDVVSWLTLYEGKPPKCRGDIEFLLLTEKGIYHATTMTDWIRLEEPFFAIGTGMHFAVAAMAGGKTPIEACKLASKYDKHTGLGFKEYSL